MKKPTLLTFVYIFSFLFSITDFVLLKIYQNNSQSMLLIEGIFGSCLLILGIVSFILYLISNKNFVRLSKIYFFIHFVSLFFSALVYLDESKNYILIIYSVIVALFSLCSFLYFIYSKKINIYKKEKKLKIKKAKSVFFYIFFTLLSVVLVFILLLGIYIYDLANSCVYTFYLDEKDTIINGNVYFNGREIGNSTTEEGTIYIPIDEMEKNNISYLTFVGLDEKNETYSISRNIDSKGNCKVNFFFGKEEIVAYQTNVSEINISDIRSKFLEEINIKLENLSLNKLFFEKKLQNITQQHLEEKLEKSNDPEFFIYELEPLINKEKYQEYLSFSYGSISFLNEEDFFSKLFNSTHENIIDSVYDWGEEYKNDIGIGIKCKKVKEEYEEIICYYLLTLVKTEHILKDYLEGGRRRYESLTDDNLDFLELKVKTNIVFSSDKKVNLYLMNSTENIYENYRKEKNIIKSKKKVDWYWENIETKRGYALLIENKEEEPVNYELIINHTFLE